jgi:hypothetical protein
MESTLSVFVGITVFFVAAPFVVLSIFTIWKSSNKNADFGMYTWEFFALCCVTSVCLWMHWVLAFLCQLNPLTGPQLKKGHAEIILYSWESDNI